MRTLQISQACFIHVQATGEFTATLIVSPMKTLLIDGMEGLTVRCLYTIADVTLTLPAGTHGAGIFVRYTICCD